MGHIRTYYGRKVRRLRKNASLAAVARAADLDCVALLNKWLELRKELEGLPWGERKRIQDAAEDLFDIYNLQKEVAGHLTRHAGIANVTAMSPQRRKAVLNWEREHGRHATPNDLVKVEELTGATE